MGIASIIGVFLGALAGFFGDRNLLMPRVKYIFTLIGCFPCLFLSVLECENIRFS